MVNKETLEKLKKLAREIEQDFQRAYALLDRYTVIKGGNKYDNGERHKNR